jgi:glycosyltransferase involved in cell wall biosynthesis
LRLLVVLAHPPLPEGSAAGRCSLAALRGLLEQRLEVRALAADPDMHQRIAPPGDLPVEVIDVLPETSYRTKVREYVEPRGWLGAGEFAARARTLAADADAIFLDEIESAPLSGLADGRTLLHLHCLAARDRRLGAPWSTATRDAVKARLAERRARRRAPHLMANSPEVGEELRSGGASDVHVVPLGLDPADYEPSARPERPVAGLIGTATWPPTANAVRRLLGEVWPRVHAARPDAVLRLGGRGMERDRFQGFDRVPGVEWVGEVPTATGFLRELSMLLYPVTRGSGTKVKVLESMFLELPVVTTPSGSEGIAANDGVLVSDDDDDLARAAVELLGDRPTQRQRGEAGRAHALSHHSPAIVGAALAQSLETIALS